MYGSKYSILSAPILLRQNSDDDKIPSAEAGAPAPVASPANYIGFGLSPAATRKRAPSVEASPAAMTSGPALSAADAYDGRGASDGTSVIAQQLRSLWQGESAGGAAASTGALVADEVGFVRDGNAHAAPVAPDVMRLSIQQRDEVWTSIKMCLIGLVFLDHVQQLTPMRQVQSMHQLLCAQKEGFLFDNSDMQVIHFVVQ